jgi:hypothetical protein
LDRQTGSQGLYNLRIGPVRLPAAPTFVVRMRGAGSEDPGARGRGPALANIAEEAEENRRVTITEASATEMAHIEEHVGRITQAIN